jgi:hypothetical protein
MLHQGDDIPTLVAPATIPNLLPHIDAEPITSTTNRARPSVFGGRDPLECRVAARSLKNVDPFRAVCALEKECRRLDERLPRLGGGCNK